MKKETYNVVQWSSGNVGKASIIGINNRKDLNLSGLIVSDENKIGMDAGAIIGIEELGVKATNNIDEFLNADLDIDCINYTPLASFRVNEDPDLDKNNIIKILKSGVNVVTTVGFLFPKAFGEDYLNEIEEACKEGGVSLHGTGYNPGWLAELVPLTMTGMSQEIKKIIVSESSEFSYYPSKEIVIDGMLMGKTMEEYEAEAERYEAWLSGLFKEAIYLIAEGIGVDGVGEIQIDCWDEEYMAHGPGQSPLNLTHAVPTRVALGCRFTHDSIELHGDHRKISTGEAPTQVGDESLEVVGIDTTLGSTHIRLTLIPDHASYTCFRVSYKGEHVVEEDAASGVRLIASRPRR